MGRNPASKHQIKPEYGEWAGWRGAGRPNPSRKTKFSGANGDREMFTFLVQLTTSRIGDLSRLIHTLLCMYGHTYSKSMDQPGKVASPVRGQLNSRNEYFPVRVRAWEFGLAGRVRQSRPASACSSPYSGWIWCLFMEFLPSSAAASIYSFITAIRHRVSPEFIVSRNWVPMEFTAESPPAQGQ